MRLIGSPPEGLEVEVVGRDAGRDEVGDDRSVQAPGPQT